MSYSQMADVNHPTIDARVQNSHCIFIAEPAGIIGQSGIKRWSFTCKEVLHGQALFDKHQIEAPAPEEKGKRIEVSQLMIPQKPYSKISSTFQSSPHVQFTKWIVFLGEYDPKDKRWSFIEEDPFLGMLEATPENIAIVRAAVLKRSPLKN